MTRPLCPISVSKTRTTGVTTTTDRGDHDMKTVLFSATAALGLLTQLPVLSGTHLTQQVQPFSAAPPVAVHVLEN